MADILEEELALNVQSSRVSWGAVLAGWLLAFSIAMLFCMLGSAIGLSTLNATDAEVVGKGFAFGTAFWVLLTWVASLYMGGLFASWQSKEPMRWLGM